jgi:multiple sugar transport system substrate-binding protein
MPEIQFTSMFGDRAVFMLDEFESKSGIKVKHTVFGWTHAWDELRSIGLSRRGPDVSQVGTTWLGSLAGMDALRYFSRSEIEKIGDEHLFADPAWQGCTLPNVHETYAIPFVLDTRLIIYRRDLLAKAGVDESTAFMTHDALIDTLKKLQAAGAAIPWAMPTSEETLRYVSAWVWGAGGHFRASDLHQLRLTDPRTIQGLTQFYELHRFLAAPAQRLSTTNVNQLFSKGEAAAVLSTHNLVTDLMTHPSGAFASDDLGAATVPGIPFVGGSGLVIWKHTSHIEAARELTRHLVSRKVQTNIFAAHGELPVRLEVLQAEPFTTESIYRVIAKSLLTGRVFQTSPMWARVETKLFPIFENLWERIFDGSVKNIQGELLDEMKRLNEEMASYL